MKDERVASTSVAQNQGEIKELILGGLAEDEEPKQSLKFLLNPIARWYFCKQENTHNRQSENERNIDVGSQT